MPRLVITVPGRNAQPYRFQLDRQSVTLGRGSENDIVVEDASVSVRHAVMERIEGGYQLRDLGSTNGTKLEGKATDLIPLRHGLSVKLGDVAFDFTLTDDERAALTREKPQSESPIIREEPFEAPAIAAAGAGVSSAAPRRPQGAPAPVIITRGPSGAASFFMSLLFLILALIAFFIGLSVRYAKENKNASLLQAIRSSHQPPAAPPAPPSEEAPKGE